MKESKEIIDFYDLGAEIGRLDRGIGKIEFERTKELILRYLPKDKVTIYDIGGGIGVYSRWLAELGHEVHLIDLSPMSIKYAETLNQSHRIKHLEVSDARFLNKPDQSADIVLLMGPMYHLTSVEDRNKALYEAKRVLKPSGLLLTSGITRYGSMLWALSVYGEKNNILNEVEFVEMIKREIKEGQHIRPDKYPYFIARSYFHLPKDFENEIKNNGFTIQKTFAIEGPGWMVPNIDEIWSNDLSKETLFNTIRIVEEDEYMMPISPHFLTVATI